jgi:hypothetical protein
MLPPAVAPGTASINGLYHDGIMHYSGGDLAREAK